MAARWLLPRIFTLCLIMGLVFPISIKAQTDIYANSLISNSSDFRQPQAAVDNDRSTYAYISTQVSVLASSHMQVRFPIAGKSGDVVNVVLQSSEPIALSLLNNMRIRLYNQSGDEVATGTGASLLQLSLLTPASNLYALRFFTSIEDTFSIREARLELTNLLSVSLFNEFRVFDFFIQPVCPPVYANAVTAYTTGLLNQVTNPNAVVDADTNNYANVMSVLNIGNILSSFIEVEFSNPPANTGNYVGFTVANEAGLLSLNVIELLEIEVIDQNGVSRGIKDDFSLANLRLLAGSSNRYTLGFQAPTGNYSIKKLRLRVGGVLGLFPNIRVYNAFQYNINRPPVAVALSQSPILCPGESVVLTASDSLGASSFSWSTGANTQSITVSQAGVYSVTVEDAFGCSRYSVPVVVSVADQPRPVIIGDTVLCTGMAGTLNVQGAFDSFAWSNGSSSDSLSIQAPGVYWVDVVDSNGCTARDSVSVTRHNLSIQAAITPAGCSGSEDGSIALQLSGGSGQYQYLWSNGGTRNNISGLSEGVYTVAILDDQFGCSYHRFYSVPSANNISISVTGIVNTSQCGASDGAISVNVIGGSGTYSYQWSNGDTTASVNHLPAGIYTLQVQDVYSGCTRSDTVVVSDGPAAFSINSSITPTQSCNAADGSISIDVVGGTGTYSYKWSNGASRSQIENLAPGSYYVLVTDEGNGCSAGATIVVPDSALNLQIQATVTDADCNNTNSGAINIIVTNGSGNYDYVWSNGATSSSIVGLPPGVYLVSVTDRSSGCTGELIIPVDQTSGPIATLAITQPTCSGDRSGSVVVTAAATNRFLWSNGSTLKDQQSLAPGTYLLSVTDTNTLCQSIYTVIISDPKPIDIQAFPVSNTSCTTPNGSINVVATGGNTPYDYSWSNGALGAAIGGLAPGIYTVTVRDSGGCEAMLSIDLGNDTSKVLTVSADTITPAHCEGSNSGSVQLKVNGATPPVIFDWSNGATTQNLQGVPSGTYTVTVSDANGCEVDLTVNIGIDTANLLSVELNQVTPVNCYDPNSGIILIDVIGGVAPIDYQWSNGAQTASLNGVPIGNYTVIVSDSRACADTLEAYVVKEDCGDQDGDSVELNIYNLLTPNGDGTNDFWIVEGIEQYPDNEVKVFDKWGDLVFEQRGYRNNWDGRLKGTGKLVPDGTYFYIVRLNAQNLTGGRSDWSGHLLIRR